MVANCGIYAIAWQKVIKKILFVNRICKPQRLSDLVQIWAVLIFMKI